MIVGAGGECLFILLRCEIAAKFVLRSCARAGRCGQCRQFVRERPKPGRQRVPAQEIVDIIPPEFGRPLDQLMPATSRRMEITINSLASTAAAWISSVRRRKTKRRSRFAPAAAAPTSTGRFMSQAGDTHRSPGDDGEIRSHALRHFHQVVRVTVRHLGVSRRLYCQPQDRGDDWARVRAPAAMHGRCLSWVCAPFRGAGGEPAPHVGPGHRLSDQGPDPIERCHSTPAMPDTPAAGSQTPSHARRDDGVAPDAGVDVTISNVRN